MDNKSYFLNDEEYSNFNSICNIVLSEDNTQNGDNSSVSSLPIGSGCDYFGTVAPEGFMFADGSAISRTEYSELFSIIGVTYGAGDGSTTFNLPDKRERVTVMYKSGSTYYGTIGGKVGNSASSFTPQGTIGGTAITKAQLPSYNLTVSDSGHTHTVSDYYRSTGGLGSDMQKSNVASTGTTYSTRTTSKNTTGITVSSGGSGNTHTHTFTGTSGNISTIQPTLICNYIIKVK